MKSTNRYQINNQIDKQEYALQKCCDTVDSDPTELNRLLEALAIDKNQFWDKGYPSHIEYFDELAAEDDSTDLFLAAICTSTECGTYPYSEDNSKIISRLYKIVKTHLQNSMTSFDPEDPDLAIQIDRFYQALRCLTGFLSNDTYLENGSMDQIDLINTWLQYIDYIDQEDSKVSYY